ncbi:hypothetical protein J6590_001218 [Homalodisca vitripennis]|nr:hypothetical protein J6590_001218 [Homalodisca vitripennis]
MTGKYPNSKLFDFNMHIGDIPPFLHHVAIPLRDKERDNYLTGLPDADNDGYSTNSNI